MNNTPSRWARLTAEHKQKLSEYMSRAGQTAEQILDTVQKGGKSPNVLQNLYPSKRQWRHRQGESGFRKFMQIWISKAKRCAEDVQDVKCSEATPRVGQYVRLQPYQVIAKYLVAPESEPGIKRMLFAHGLGTSKTLSTRLRCQKNI